MRVQAAEDPEFSSLSLHFRNHYRTMVKAHALVHPGKEIISTLSVFWMQN
jgi:hypothetical protein